MIKKALSQVGLGPKRQSASDKKRSVRMGESSSGSSEDREIAASFGIGFGSSTVQGKFHKNEDVIVEPIPLADTLDTAFTRMIRDTSESKVEEVQETSSFTELNLSDVTFTAIFDGHGGSDCAKYMSEALPARVAYLASQTSLKSFDDLCSSSLVSTAFLQCESEFEETCPFSPSGACVVAALVYKSSFLLAWLGDCRAVLYSGSNVLPLTADHRTSNQMEFNRIIQAGGSVVNDRVMGILAPTRAFGDNDIKRRYPGLVSTDPSVLSFTIDENEVPSDMSFLVLASDGVYDAFSNQRVCEIVAKALEKSSDPKEAAKQLVSAAARSNFDDVSATVIVWNHKKRLVAQGSTSRA